MMSNDKLSSLGIDFSDSFLIRPAISKHPIKSDQLGVSNGGGRAIKKMLPFLIGADGVVCSTEIYKVASRHSNHPAFR